MKRLALTATILAVAVGSAASAASAARSPNQVCGCEGGSLGNLVSPKQIPIGEGGSGNLQKVKKVKLVYRGRH